LAVWVVGIQLVLDLDVEISWVLGVRSAVKNTTNLLALLDSKDFTEVEDGLLPVSVLGVWASGETDWLVASGEVNVEPRNKSMDKVISSAVEDEWGCESEVGNGAGVEVEGEDCGWVGNNSLDLNCVDKRLSKSSLLERRIIEAVDVIPD
jgi:hypothetical protein